MTTSLKKKSFIYFELHLFFLLSISCQPSLQIDFPTEPTPLNKKEVVSRRPPGSPNSPQQPPGGPRHLLGSPLHPLGSQRKPLGSPRHPLGSSQQPPTNGPLQPHDQPNRPNQNKESTFLENTSKDTATQKAGLTEDELVIIFKYM